MLSTSTQKYWEPQQTFNYSDMSNSCTSCAAITRAMEEETTKQSPQFSVTHETCMEACLKQSMVCK